MYESIASYSIMHANRRAIPRLTIYCMGMMLSSLSHHREHCKEIVMRGVRMQPCQKQLYEEAGRHIRDRAVAIDGIPDAVMEVASNIHAGLPWL